MTQHLGEIFEALYLTDSVAKSLVIRKGHRYLKTCRQNLLACLSAYDPLLPPDTKRLTQLIDV